MGDPKRVTLFCFGAPGSFQYEARQDGPQRLSSRFKWPSSSKDALVNLFKTLPLLILFTLVLGSPLYAQERKIPRTKVPPIKPHSKRSPTPRKYEIKAADRLAARDLFAYLRFNRFDKAEKLILKLKKQGRLEDVRLAFFELWPSPKVLTEIAKRVQTQKASRRKILEPWVTAPRAPRSKKEKEPQRTPQKGKLFLK